MIIKLLKFFIISWLNIGLIYANDKTFVYNLKVAETTRRHYTFEKMYTHPFLAAATFLEQYHEKGDGSRELIGGGLLSLIYSPKSSFYIRGDFSVARATKKCGDITDSVTQTDDLLFSGGYATSINERARLTFSGLFGVPTHKDKVLCGGIQFGYAHFSLGAQVDGSFVISHDKNTTIRTAARFIHFFKRSDVCGCKKYDFELGNLADLFFTYHKVFGFHRVEIGYNPIFFFGANVRPKIDLGDIDYIRSSFYGSYKYHFTINKHLNSFIVAFSYGFDHKPKCIGNKKILFGWISYEINF